MNHEAVEVIDSLIGRRRKVGEQLLNKYVTMQGVFQNIDNLPVTERQRDILRSALSLRFVSELPGAVRSPADIADLCAGLELEPQEHLVVIGMDRKNGILFKEMVYKGSVCSAQIRIAELFRTAIIRNASAIAVVHNHPSGDPTPSPDDVAVTRAIVQAGKLLDIDVIDHIVIGFGKWVSLKERGLGGF